MTARTVSSAFAILIALLMTAISGLASLPKIDRDFNSGAIGCRWISRTHHKSRALISLFLMVVLAISMMTMLFQQPNESDDTPSERPTPAGSMYVYHHEIRIQGNEGFLEPNSSTGISWGSGTESDPYIIEGWNIIVGSYFGISISASDVHFIVRSCYIYPDDFPYIDLFILYGICLSESPNGTLDSNICSLFPIGIGVFWSTNNNLVNNTCSRCAYGISLGSSSNVSISNNTCSNSTYGIWMDSSSNITISNNTMIGSSMFMEGSDQSHFNTHNIDASNTVNGKPVRYYKNQMGMTVPEGAGQVILANCTDFVVENQNLSGTFVGVELAFSSGTTITNNTCSNTKYGRYGIYLYSSSNITISNNTMIGSSMFMEGSDQSHFNTHNIDASNTVNGKPVRYYKNQMGMTVPEGAGQVILANCTDFVVENQNLNATVGIELAFSSRTTVTNSIFSHDRYAMYLESSSNNTLANNTCPSIRIFAQSSSSISLRQSGNNTVSNNTCSHGGNGIYLDLSSNNNLLTDNTCSNSTYGIWMDSSSNSNTLDNNNCSSNWRGIFLHGSSINTLTNNTCSDNSYGIVLHSSSNCTIEDNNCSSNDYFGICFSNSNSNVVTRNSLCENLDYGMKIDAWGSTNSANNRIWNNTFYHNNGAGDTYDPSHIQAYDDGTNNWWNSSDGYGNWWSDWRAPDDDWDGIVDYPYNISGWAGAKDYYPQTIPGTPIPEFGATGVVVVIIATVCIFVALRRISLPSSKA